MINTEGKTVVEVLDEVLGKLIQQGGRCVNDNNNCLYGSEGRHCAVGWLLPDVRSLMTFQGSVNQLLEAPRRASLGPNEAFLNKHRDVLRTLQRLHDVNDSEGLSAQAEALRQQLGSEIPLLKDWVEMRRLQIES